MLNIYNDIFLLDGLDASQTIAYIPAIGIALDVDGEIAKYIRSRQKGVIITKPSDKEAVFDHFIIDYIGSFKLEEPIASDEYLPTSLVLCPTTGCNMRCIYCYANGGDLNRNMPKNMAELAIDKIISNAKSVEHKEIFITFHGGGEPTLNWQLLKHAVFYSIQRCKEENIEPHFSLTSNGVAIDSRLKFLLDRLESINISMDGNRQTQNTQRPLANGGKSYELVDKTLRYLSSKNIPVNLRMTVTEASLESMVANGLFLIEKYKPNILQIEPVSNCGRCTSTEVKTPDPYVFSDNFLELLRHASSSQITCMYSGADLNYKETFCGSVNGIFCVTPDGLITSCLEVVEPSHKNADLFIFGRINLETQQIIINQEKLNKLKKLRTESYNKCLKCFCKYTCAGDCPNKRSYTSGIDNSEPDYRCTINQYITKKIIIDSLSDNPKIGNLPLEHEDLSQS